MHAGDETTRREWFAVQVWSGREQLSARHLRLRGYEVFLPCYREQRRWSDRVKVVERALFAGYVFCRVEADVVGKIVTAPGVIKMVGAGSGRPISIPTDEIGAIQPIVAARLSTEPTPMPRAGQRVRVEQGPLRGLEGIVQVVQNHHRLIVSISLLQRAVAVSVDADWISIPRGQ